MVPSARGEAGATSITSWLRRRIIARWMAAEPPLRGRPLPSRARSASAAHVESATKPQALAAGAVLRGYVQHQRERLGDQAATNPNFQNVSAALRAIETQTGSTEYGSGSADRPQGRPERQGFQPDQSARRTCSSPEAVRSRVP
jgi:hypothetical protein